MSSTFSMNSPPEPKNQNSVTILRLNTQHLKLSDMKLKANNRKFTPKTIIKRNGFFPFENLKELSHDLRNNSPFTRFSTKRKKTSSQRSSLNSARARRGKGKT